MSRPVTINKTLTIEDQAKHWYDNFNPSDIVQDPNINHYE